MSSSVFASFIGDNAFQVDAAEAEAKIRDKYPLLLHSKESIEFAFTDRGGVGRDKSFFTSHRILIKDGKGIGSKRKNYLSIPYSSIQAFSVETAGKLDGDVELKIRTRGMASSQSIDFAAGQVDIFAVQQFMNTKVDWEHELSDGQDHVDGTPVHTDKQGNFSNLMDWIGNNAKQLTPGEIEQRLKTVTPVLLQDEKVEMAFRAGRDSTVFTNKRLMIIDVKGITGQRVEFKSFAWSSLSGFSVETAGAYLDRDSDMKIYTNIVSYGVIKQDFRKGRADLMAINKYLCNQILGKDKSPVPDVDRRSGHVDPKGSWWFRSDQRPLDANEINRYYHNDVPILQGSETVEFAFKGRRDITLFTTKRLIDIDPKGWKGVKIEYTSVPWKSVVGFGVKTAGKHMDRDAEVRLWTDMCFIPGNGEDPPEPGMSFLELDFNKDMVNVMVLKKYLSARLLEGTPGVPIQPSVLMTSEKEQGLEKLLSKIGDDQRAISPEEINRELHTTNPILLDDENIVMAFKAGRDITLFTNLRILELDVQGWSGQKIAYTSIPYSSIRAFSAESAGGWDRDSEVDVYTRNLWDMRKFGMDFRKGKADIIAIQKFLSAIILGNHEDAARYFSSTASPVETTNPAGLNSFLSWLTDNASEENAEVTNAQLHSDPPILLSDERVNRSFREGRDLYVYTTHRVLVIDVQGLRGKKVEYCSIPNKWSTAFEIETAGNFDRDAEVYVHTDVPGKSTIKLSILVKKHDIYEMHEYLTGRLLFDDN